MIPLSLAYQDLIKNPKGKEPRSPISLSTYLTNISCSPFKQSVSMLITGAKGMGKSYAALSIANACSMRLSERLGGHPTDYFNPEIDMAIINEEEVDRVSCLQRRHGIKIYDDCSIGWSSRSWRSQSSARKNDIFTIDRVSQGISIFTLPQAFQLDKIPRSLVGFYCEMEQRYFSRGFSTMKFFKTVFLGRDNELTYRHINEADTKYVLYVIPKPPQELADWYDKARERITNEEIAKRRNVPEEPKKERAPDPRFAKMQERIAQYKDQIVSLPMKEKIKFLTSHGVPRETAYYWKNQGYLTEI